MEREYRVSRSVELGGSPRAVWATVGGFYNIHTWHPDIVKTTVPRDQTLVSPMRRELTFPDQPVTVEELILMDNDALRYRYKWVDGEWGERVKNYRAELSIAGDDHDSRCVVTWSSTFVYSEDAISAFYLNGFRELLGRFPLY